MLQTLQEMERAVAYNGVGVIEKDFFFWIDSLKDEKGLFLNSLSFDIKGKIGIVLEDFDIHESYIAPHSNNLRFLNTYYVDKDSFYFDLAEYRKKVGKLDTIQVLRDLIEDMEINDIPETTIINHLEEIIDRVKQC